MAGKRQEDEEGAATATPPTLLARAKKKLPPPPLPPLLAQRRCCCCHSHASNPFSRAKVPRSGTCTAPKLPASSPRSRSAPPPPPKCENDKYGGDCSVDYCLGSRTLAGSGEVTATYRNNAACGWLIEAETDSSAIQVSAPAREGGAALPGGAAVVLLYRVVLPPPLNPNYPASARQVEFNEFKTEIGFDFVFIYDGPTAASPLLGKFSGTSLPPALASTSSSVLVYFESDNMIHKGGGFSFRHTEVASAQEVEGGCQLGFFGFKCDTQVCFGSSRVAVGVDGSTQVSELLPAVAG